MKKSFVDNLWAAFSVTIDWKAVGAVTLGCVIALAWVIFLSLPLIMVFIEGRPIRWYWVIVWLLAGVVGYAVSYALMVTYFFN